MDSPVYAVTGFLDGGKTNFINGILQDGFANRQARIGYRGSSARWKRAGISPSSS